MAAQTKGTQSDSAKAGAIVARHVAALGGAAVFRDLKHTHTVMTTSMSVPGAPEVRAEVYAKAPNLVYMKMDMPGMGTMEMGFDGKTAWSTSTATGPTIHDEVPKELTDAANFGAPPLAGLKVSYVGRRQIGGRALDAIKGVMADSQSMIHYFDVETGLLAGMDPDGGTPPPPDRMTMAFEDYKRFGPILHATKVTTVAQGMEMVMRTVSVSHEPFDVKIFDPPAAVRQLRAKPPQR